jgi:hypothetical protein
MRIVRRRKFKARRAHSEEMERWSEYAKRQGVDVAYILYAFLHDVWAVVELLFLFYFYAWFARTIAVELEVGDVRDLVRGRKDSAMYTDPDADFGFIDLGPHHELYMETQRYMGYTALFIALRMLKYLKLLPVLDLIISAITRAIGSVFALIFIWFFTRVGFVWFCVFAFGTEVYGMRDYASAFVTTTLVMVGMADEENLPPLDATTTPWTLQLVFWTVFIAWEYFAVFTMFPVILTYYYREVEQVSYNVRAYFFIPVSPPC